MAGPESCIFCFDSIGGNEAVPAERVVGEFDHWWLVLQREQTRKATKTAAGMLVIKRHIEVVSLASPEEAAELVTAIKPAAEALCEAAGTVYLGQENVGFNQGRWAGQSVDHAHVHILPLSDTDPLELHFRGGFIGAFEALRAARLGGQQTS